jgi:formate/nitrite transporter FocA (FNT family)
MGKDAAHVAASLGFGVGFVFIVVGRAELFTENFLVPLAGLDRRSHESWLGLARLCWSFVAGNFFVAAAGNMLGGLLLVTLTRFTQAIHGGKALASA